MKLLTKTEMAALLQKPDLERLASEICAGTLVASINEDGKAYVIVKSEFVSFLFLLELIGLL